MPSLNCANLEDIKHSAAQFRQAHPTVEPSTLSWGERIFDRQARDAYTMACFDSAAIEAVRQYGARPCVRCGISQPHGVRAVPCLHQWRCARNVTGILCPGCVSDGKLYSVVKSQAPSDTIEISGYMNTKNEYQRVDPPLLLQAAEVPKIDGVYDMAYITQRIMRRSRPRPRSPRSTMVPLGPLGEAPSSTTSGWLGTETPGAVVSKAPPKAARKSKPVPTPPGLH